jgi:hypothetical protein
MISSKDEHDSLFGTENASLWLLLFLIAAGQQNDSAVSALVLQRSGGRHWQ